jgi:hypothetical protein
MKRLVFPLLAAVSAMPAHSRPFKELCDQFEPFRKVSDLKYVKPTVRVKPNSESVRPQDVVFTLGAKSGPIRIVPDADGRVEFPFSDALCKENPELEVNQPKGTISVTVTIDPSIPPVRTLDYRMLEALRLEWGTAVSRQGLVMRTLAPSPKAFQVAFDPARGGSAEVRLPQGTRTLKSDAKGELRIPFEPAWVGLNPAIVLSEMPRRIGLGFKD